jgi:hypothetical protein
MYTRGGAKMKRNLILILFILFNLIRPQHIHSNEEPFCPQVASYNMDVTLDTERNIIKGTEILTWVNGSEFDVSDLWFHLYWNAFQNNKSTFITEGAERTESIIENFNKEDWGYCQVDSIRIVESEIFTGYDLQPSFNYRNPDDDNLYDKTVFSVTLPEPIKAGEKIHLEITFTSKVPRPISRTGVYRGYYFIAQWFPKIGVFQNGRWNCHQYHSPGEYFADYGTYDVKITLPSSYIVGATGEHRQKIEKVDSTTTHHFYQHSVHDFAWTASRRFLEYKEDFEFAPGKMTEITLLLQPEHINVKERYMNAVKNAVKYCSLWYGDYPYTTITCVDPAFNSDSGGMEYPTFFTGGAYFIPRKGISRPERVTIHEFGHGYFYGLIGNNEFENAWMDEGLTDFLDAEIYYEAYGKPLYDKQFFGIPITFKNVKIPIESDGISDHRQTFDMDMLQRFSWQFMGRESYGSNSYDKGKLMIRTLKRYMGQEIFARMIKAYSTRWWFKHPQPKDFYDVVAEFAGEDMSWWLDQFIYGSEKCDYAIESINNEEEIAPEGLFEGNYIHVSKRRAKNTEDTFYESEVLVRRLGEIKLPVEVLIIFEDGRRIRETWDGQYRWKKFVYRSPARIKTATVDPDFKLVIDINRTNNSKKIKANIIGPLKWVSNWLVWLQHAFEFFTVFGG